MKPRHGDIKKGMAYPEFDGIPINKIILTSQALILGECVTLRHLVVEGLVNVLLDTLMQGVPPFFDRYVIL